MTGLPISTDWNEDNHNFIFVIVNQLIKMVNYNLVKVTINAPGLVEVRIDVVIWDYGLSNLIVIDRGFLFTLKLWSSLCYLLGMKQ